MEGTGRANLSVCLKNEAVHPRNSYYLLFSSLLLFGVLNPIVHNQNLRIELRRE
jgi:hypothetical protein